MTNNKSDNLFLLLKNINAPLVIVNLANYKIDFVNNALCILLNTTPSVIQNQEASYIFSLEAIEQLKKIKKEASEEFLDLNLSESFKKTYRFNYSIITISDSEYILLSIPDNETIQSLFLRGKCCSDKSKVKTESDDLELCKAKFLLESLVEKSPVAIIIASFPNGIVEYVNEAYADFFAINEYKRLIGTSIFEYSPDWIEYDLNNNIVPKEETSLEMAMRGLYFCNKQYKVILKNNDEKYMQVHGIPIIGINNEIVAAYVIFSDITTIKLQKQKLRNQAQEITLQNQNLLKLNNKLQERNELILNINEQLSKSKEKAQQADKLKTAFLANMSHEIRTPMNAIVGFSELLSDDMADVNMRKEYVKIIQASSNQLMRIITDILDISKIEANQLIINVSEFNIIHLFKELYTVFKEFIQRTGKKYLQFSLDITLSDKDIIIKSDEQRIRQIISNLLENAVKFTDVGDIILGCKKEENYISVYVKDTGSGIKDTEKIFNRFYQEETQISKLAGGTGLGLSITKGLVELLGGYISVSNNKDIGCTFTFTIPLKNNEKNFHPHELIQSKLDSKIPHLQGKNILVVEDEAEIFKYIEAVLSPTRANVVWENNGENALKQILETDSYHLILMDVRLPGMNGLDITKKVKATKPHIPIIIQTAYAMPNDKQLACEAGCNAFLTKPIRKEILYSTIKKIMEQNSLE